MRLTQYEKIVICAKRKDITLSKIYKEVGISQTNGSKNIKTGKWNPIHFAKICELLDIEPEYLKDDFKE